MQLYIGIFIGILSIFGLAFVRSGFVVKEGQLGLVTSFGALIRQGSRARVYAPGFHAKMPWHQAHIIDCMEKTFELDKDLRFALTADGTLISFHAVARYWPLPDDLEQYRFGVANLETHLSHLLSCLLRNEIANFQEDAAQSSKSGPLPGGAFALLRRERRQLSTKLTQLCREKLESRYGLKLHSVELLDIDAPEALSEALNAVVDAESMSAEQHFRAEYESRQRIVEAQQSVEIAKLKASAVEIEIKTLGSHLAGLAKTGTLKDYIERRESELLTAASTAYVALDSHAAGLSKSASEVAHG